MEAEIINQLNNTLDDLEQRNQDINKCFNKYFEGAYL